MNESGGVEDTSPNLACTKNEENIDWVNHVSWFASVIDVLTSSMLTCVPVYWHEYIRRLLLLKKLSKCTSCQSHSLLT